MLTDWCAANGDYLIRAENIAIHAASSKNGAQFYVRPPESPPSS